MQLVITLPGLVNAAGAFLFLVAGLAILTIAHRSRRGRLVGGLATTFGFLFVIENVLDYRGDPAAAAVMGVAAWLTIVFVILVALDLTAGATRRARRALAASGVMLAGMSVAALAIVGDPDLGRGWSRPLAIFTSHALWTLQFAMLFLLLAGAAAFHGASTAAERGAIASLTLAFGCYSVLLGVWNVAAGGSNAAFASLYPLLWLWVGVTVVRGALMVTAISAFILGHRGPSAAWARGVFLTLVAVGLTAVILLISSSDFGAFGEHGIARAVGVVFLVIAITRYGLLGVPLPRVAVNRGALAAGILATLFIVAEIAQNFLSAELGLVTGGIVAGTLLFAAHPIQRAMERITEGRQVPADARTAPGPMAAPSTPALNPVESGARREAIYLDNIRLAVRDRRLTRAEESQLLKLADELSIGASRAHELIVQAEAEAEAR